MPPNQQILHTVPFDMEGQRLDQIVASLCPEYSRSQIQKWIKAGNVRVDDKILKPKERLTGGEQITLNAELEVQTEFEPEDIPLGIVYEDDAIMIINKPVGLVVHPAAGNWSGTLVNALLHHSPSLAMLPRAGIVHRLDKDTSGLMVVAKTLEAHTKLVELLQERDVSREYLALVFGQVVAGSTIEANIGRHHIDRKKQAVTDGGKEAITHYRVEERFPHHTLLRVSLETGRTHQIRVHLSWKHMPIVGDQTYGGRPRVPAGISEALRTALQSFPRQALHATKLGLVHPETSEYREWETPIPEDMAGLLALLREEM
ncbi:23S rRNA pseudouridine(1911/1915/1917) synthase RluD [Thiothrix nivea]|uniref:Pseudouridine synthase n=1 Tax=Thiothrix nivea (strain ATCC 35100 / DSM 5205 / JP2) TaxID=870187 RepID=A0A656HMB7_THINJ|nr:23S rRNA pseudouridine(1911/1915/1917) synthase RluD [Thiothrix nivea]EIJ36459.1 ribosomal large subunit pseudouridine synthase D [Thiothrix nivea DSM 5205]